LHIYIEGQIKEKEKAERESRERKEPKEREERERVKRKRNACRSFRVGTQKEYII